MPLRVIELLVDMLVFSVRRHGLLCYRVDAHVGSAW